MVSVRRGLPSQYCKIISASKARRFGLIILAGQSSVNLLTDSVIIPDQHRLSYPHQGQAPQGRCAELSMMVHKMAASSVGGTGSPQSLPRYNDLAESLATLRLS
jgi:hypothetical protein